MNTPLTATATVTAVQTMTFANAQDYAAAKLWAASLPNLQAQVSYNDAQRQVVFSQNDTIDSLTS